MSYFPTKKILLIAVIISSCLFITGCFNYGFTGGSLPEHIKSVQILLFEDQTNRYDLRLSETITNQMSEKIDKQKLLEIENSSEADSRISGVITSYVEAVATQTQAEIADERDLKIVVKLSFYDSLKEKEIVTSTVEKSERYLASQGESAREEALKKLLDQVSDELVIKLTSNW